MKELEYPFDSDYILKKKKSLKRQLLEQDNLLEKKIAILGGSTTNDIKLILELFLLNYGIKPVFYESEYNQFYQDAVFGNEELDNFKPDIIYIHTTNRNITKYPNVSMEGKEIEDMMEEEYLKFTNVWENLTKKFNSVIIQNNFEYPYYRLLGNKDASSKYGKINYITKLNMKFYEYAENHDNFYINDINYLSASYGLDKWFNEFYWYMYKYALEVPAIPTLAFNIAKIIKSIYGKNKKAFALDLDNTLWGGIVGDDGVENIVIGPEVPEGQVFSEFQNYLKEHKDIGVILNVVSKNEEENAIAGLNHEEGILKPEDFVSIKANWNPKNVNIQELADELNIGEDSFVFVDDNPAERKIVKENIKGIAVPELDVPENYIKMIDKQGYFEVTNISKEDTKKTKMYKENAERAKKMKEFTNYEDYLYSLEMRAEIKSFVPLYTARISQLTNKSNQFNLTTKRYSQAEIEQTGKSNKYITLYGKLEDTFGDNGIVSVVIGEKKGKELHIDLWIMSCRVLKRDMEFAMMDTLVKKCKEQGIETIYGYYYPTAKNKMVKDFYSLHGFEKIKENEQGDTIWKIDVSKYKEKNKVIKVEE